eukprot:CAMPEP_0171657484 /NCGR_PEP_ID=MMETSP0990-20121206/42299_1 /TAXON_ID=483369 /ORGANISM="non described non described, Strain CCMP2098" /LENGTH=451 /DNA_ID=CAMNT_0012238347 /DNA_START=16 /DNA_END=1371 /DNA_ORIENTATION=-
MKGSRLLCTLAALVPACGFAPSLHRGSFRSVISSAENVDGTKQLRSRRTVKVVLPTDAVAAKKKKRRSTVQRLEPPSAVGSSQEAKARKPAQFVGDMPSEVTAVKEVPPPSYMASTSAMVDRAFNTVSNSFWLGTVAPAAAAGVGLTFVAKKSKERVEARQQSLVTNYAFELLKYDGNMATLKEVQAEYEKKGSKALKDKCVLEYLRRFFTKRVVSGASVRSLAFMIALNKLDDAKAAELLCAFGEEIKSKPLSLNKLLFFSERILKDPKALALLEPFKATAVENYGGVEAIFAATMESLASGAFKSFVDDGFSEGYDLASARVACVAEGKLLGFSEEAALEEFDKLLAEQQAVADAEEEKIKAGLAQVDGAEEEEEEEDFGAQMRAEAAGGGGGGGGPVSAEAGGKLIVECTKCQNVMFVAAGRENKFFGPDFVCPNCGAPKSDQKTRQG